MKVYRKYMIADYNIIGIKAKFLISFSTTVTTGDHMVHLLGAKIEGEKGEDSQDFTFYSSPGKYPYIDKFVFSTLDTNLAFRKDAFESMYLGRYEIYDDTPKLLFEVGD